MKWIISLLLLIISVGCASIPKLFLSLHNNEEKSYGYTIENPICIGYYSDWAKSTKAAWYFLSKLQKDGHSLRLVRHYSYPRPKSLQSKSTEPLRWGSEPNTDNLLDRFDLVLRGSTDTTIVVLYFDVILKGEIKVPLGLKYVENSQNDIFQKEAIGNSSK